jgi:hypothetical protein
MKIEKLSVISKRCANHPIIDMITKLLYYRYYIVASNIQKQPVDI